MISLTSPSKAVGTFLAEEYWLFGLLISYRMNPAAAFTRVNKLSLANPGDYNVVDWLVTSGWQDCAYHLTKVRVKGSVAREVFKALVRRPTHLDITTVSEDELGRLDCGMSSAGLAAYLLFTRPQQHTAVRTPATTTWLVRTSSYNLPQVGREYSSWVREFLVAAADEPLPELHALIWGIKTTGEQHGRS